MKLVWCSNTNTVKLCFHRVCEAHYTLFVNKQRNKFLVKNYGSVKSVNKQRIDRHTHTHTHTLTYVLFIIPCLIWRKLFCNKPTKTGNQLQNKMIKLSLFPHFLCLATATRCNFFPQVSVNNSAGNDFFFFLVLGVYYDFSYLSPLTQFFLLLLA